MPGASRGIARCMGDTACCRNAHCCCWLAGLAVLVANWLTGGRAGRHAAALVSVLSFA